MKPVFVNGVVAGSQADALAVCIRDVFLKSSDNLAWLGDGDTVLLNLRSILLIPTPRQRTRSRYGL